MTRYRLNDLFVVRKDKGLPRLSFHGRSRVSIHERRENDRLDGTSNVEEKIQATTPLKGLDSLVKATS